MPARRAEASKARASGSGWRPPVATAVAQRAREVAAEVEESGAGHMVLEPATLTRGGVGQREAASRPRPGPARPDARPASPRSPVGRMVRSRVASVRPLGAGARPARAEPGPLLASARRKLSSDVATARQAAALSDIPQWLASTSTCSSAAGSRQARQSTIPSLRNRRTRSRRRRGGARRVAPRSRHSSRPRDRSA